MWFHPLVQQDVFGAGDSRRDMEDKKKHFPKLPFTAKKKGVKKRQTQKEKLRSADMARLSFQYMLNTIHKYSTFYESGAGHSKKQY